MWHCMTAMTQLRNSIGHAQDVEKYKQAKSANIQTENKGYRPAHFDWSLSEIMTLISFWEAEFLLL